MIDKKDYLDSLNMARRKRNQKNYIPYLIGLGIFIIFIFILVLIIRNNRQSVSPAANPVQTAEETTRSAEELQQQEEQDEINKAIALYKNLGIVKVSGYLNIRESPDPGADVIGKLLDDGACEILETSGEWYFISSGEIEGYIHSQYVLTGDKALEAAPSLVKKRAIVLTDNLNIREKPGTDSEVIGQVFKDERYEILGEENGWYQISSGYISSDFVETRYCFNEARKLDLKTMVLNLYDNIGISDVTNYLNVREEPKEDGKIIGKMPSKAAGNITETLDGWYKIQSGSITGYVKSDYILTGDAAKQEALDTAELMAIVSTDVLNARSEPSTEAAIWTQITNNERYAVLSQSDGWVEIELDSTSAFVSTDYVDVRYALNEAIKFSPLEEKANAQASLRNQICNYALQFLGNPYVWGGTSLTNGADCSGFVLSVMKHFGISLPHYSGSQAKMGKAVNSSEMRPGDLVFYADSRGVINHVGMYIGNGQIVNAASRRSGIKISAWNYRTPVKIRNIID